MYTMMLHPKTGAELEFKLGGDRDHCDLLLFEGTYRFLFQAEAATDAPAYFDLGEGTWLRVDDGSLSLVPARDGKQLPIRDSYGFVLQDEWALALNQCLHFLFASLLGERNERPYKGKGAMFWPFPGIDIKCDGVCFTVNGQPLAVSDTKSLTDKLFSLAFGS